MDQATRSLATLFKTLGDPTRLRIMLTLLNSGEQCVGDLATQLAMSESAVSHQLRVLRLQRLVHDHKHGRNVTYCVDDAHVEALLRQAMEHYTEQQI